MPIHAEFARRLAPIMPELVERHGTPFHIYDEAGILATHRAVVSAFAGERFRQYFAVKALPNPAVLTALVRAGSGLDCSSAVELQLARASGAVGEDVVFTSNNTSREEYEQALAAGALVTFDDERYLARASELPSIVAFRVSPQGSAARSTLMGRAGESKFGVPRARLVSAYAEARRRGAQRFGIHGMTCANELDAGHAIRAAQELVEDAQVIARALGIHFDYINFGGGLGIPYRPEDPPFELAALAVAIREALAALPEPRPRVLMECGRYISGPHGVLVARVINRVRKEREIAGLDASMSALMRPAIYPSAYHHISLPFAEARPSVTVDVVGSLCENIDRFAVGRTMPDPAEGDIVYVHDTGAHGHAMGFTYNGRLRPAELLLRESGEVVEIRRAEGFEDYVATVRWEPLPVHAGANQREGEHSP